jgi:hypothetical protein
MMVWIWDASGPAADACGVAGTADAARRAAGSLLISGRARDAHVEQAAMVIGRALTYDYCPTGRAWAGRMESGGLAWFPVPLLPGECEFDAPMGAPNSHSSFGQAAS